MHSGLLEGAASSLVPQAPRHTLLAPTLPSSTGSPPPPLPWTSPIARPPSNPHILPHSCLFASFSHMLFSEHPLLPGAENGKEPRSGLRDAGHGRKGPCPPVLLGSSPSFQHSLDL